jgi:uncharacterized ferritin-like protein (DUF455 family)
MTISMDSPDERPVKTILVAIHYTNGNSGWALVDARKVGRTYEISHYASAHLQHEISGTNMSASQQTLDVHRSFTKRPNKFYREWGAASTISDTGRVPIK